MMTFDMNTASDAFTDEKFEKLLKYGKFLKSLREKNKRKSPC